ncbi:MAG: hypothetical protein BGO39_16535 [Chloroflexi bacterium 54-19]|nr:MAG: hypothetical protein BGO39_16535 [Chloroflexi bacterium 54-19]
MNSSLYSSKFLHETPQYISRGLDHLFSDCIYKACPTFSASKTTGFQAKMNLRPEDPAKDKT